MPSQIGSTPGTVIEGKRLWRIVLNRNQNLLGRCMLVLAREETDVTRITSAEWTELYQQIIRVKNALDQLFEPDHYNYAFLMNQDPQVHLHVIPRYRASREWNGNQFDDPKFGSMIRPETRPLEPAELSRISAAIACTMHNKTSELQTTTCWGCGPEGVRFQ
jgi:diadenosine tetraphosphate (Ap4A) HIT family hydrolase